MKVQPWALLPFAVVLLVLGGCGSPEPPASAPGGPQSLDAEAPISTQVSLSWAPVEGALWYRVYRGSSPESLSLAVPEVRGLHYQDTGLEPGSSPSYRIRAVLPSGESRSSPLASVVLKPGATRSLEAKADDGKVLLSWDAVPSARAYRVYRESLGGPASPVSFLVEGAPAPTQVSDPWDGSAVYYEVAAVNEAGENAADSPTVAVPPRKPARPASPRTPVAGVPEPTPWPPAQTPAPWSGTLDAQVGSEGPQAVPFWLPDQNRPVQAVLVLSGLSLPALPGLQAFLSAANIAAVSLPRYNFGTPEEPVYRAPADDPAHEVGVVDLQWPQRSALRLQALLDRAVQRFPGHPEFATAGWIFFGFSEGVVHLAQAAVRAPVKGRVLAAVDFCELNADRWIPSSYLTSVPHLFVASGLDDLYSTLDRGLEAHPTVTYDDFARGLATNQGAPLTVYNHPGKRHGEDPDDPFIVVWLRSVVARRLAEAGPGSAPGYPSWQGRQAWVGHYRLERSEQPPWGTPGSSGVRLTDLRVEPATDGQPGQATWLPDRETAEGWLGAAGQPLR